MDLSVIVLTWNSERYIEKCIGSLVGSLNETDLDYEILVMDNGSTDRTVSLLEGVGMSERIFIQALSTNLGTTVPRNLALKKARGEFLCIMDSDVEVTSGLFPELRALLRGDERVGLAVPRIYYPNGLVQKSCDRFPTLLHKVNRFFRLRAMEASEAQRLEGLDRSVPVDYAISAFWFFPRRILAEVGFLDEKIFYSPEDVDYCLRVWKANYRIVYVPKVSVVHHTQEISRGWRISRAKVSHLKGLFYLFLKHRYFFKAPTFQGAS